MLKYTYIIFIIFTGTLNVLPLPVKAQSNVTLFGRSVSVPLVKKKAEDGDATAMLLLSVMYEKGFGLEKDSLEGLNWL
jgi:TPR repeat protein